LNTYGIGKGIGNYIGHKMQLFFQTRQWQHVGFEVEKPSQSRYFQVLAQAIETEDLALLEKIDSLLFNTDWQKIEAKLIEEGWRDNMEVRYEGGKIFIVYKAST